MSTKNSPVTAPSYTPLTVMSNMSKLTSGVVYNHSIPVSFGSGTGYCNALYSYDQGGNYLNMVHARSAGATTESVQSLLGESMNMMKENQQYIYLFWAQNIHAIDWSVFNELNIDSIKGFGAGVEFDDVTQKATYSGSSSYYGICYCLASLVYKISDISVAAANAFESANIGRYAQCGLSLMVESSEDPVDSDKTYINLVDHNK